MVDSEDEELPAKELRRVTTWMQFLQNFASTEGESCIVCAIVQTILILIEAKAALERGGLQEYNKVASHFYKKLSEEEKRELNKQRNTEPARRMSKQEVRATGKKIIQKIQKLVSPLIFNTKFMH